MNETEAQSNKWIFISLIRFSYGTDHKDIFLTRVAFNSIKKIF